MRFSTILVHDAIIHQWFYLCAVAAGIVFWRIIRSSTELLRVPPWILRVLLLTGGGILLCSYITKTGFYTPYSPGTQGDNFYLLSGALRDPRYFHVRHLIFPGIGAAFVRLWCRLGLLT